MDWQSAVFDVIDMRSFATLWFWLTLAAVWAIASHWVLGVPYDMVTRAARRGGQAEADLEDLVRVNVNRTLFVAEAAWTWLVGILFFLLTMLAILGFGYGIEFAQAVFCILLPMSFVWAMALRTAERIRAEDLAGAALRAALWRQRMLTQAVGMVAIFVTSLWGMYQNLTSLPLGN